MNYKILFQERAKLSMEQLVKQLPVALQEARAQAERLKNNSASLDKKKRV